MLNAVVSCDLSSMVIGKRRMCSVWSNQRVRGGATRGCGVEQPGDAGWFKVQEVGTGGIRDLTIVAQTIFNDGNCGTQDAFRITFREAGGAFPPGNLVAPVAPIIIMV